MNAVIYARYSSDRQDEQSIEGQLNECYNYAKRYDYTVVGEYIDRAKSGRYDDREQFQKMIADAKKKQFDKIIVYKLDRFARNRYDSAMYKHELKKYGVRVVSAMENLTDSPESVMLEAILEANAEYFSLNLAQNVKRGMYESAKKGLFTGGYIPLGYKVNEEKKLVIDNNTALVTKYIFNSYADGHSKTDIVNECNRRGYKTARGNTFKISSLDTILTNKMYIGDYNYKNEIERECPAIISTEIFDKCAKILEQNKRKRGQKKHYANFLLTGKLFCGYCGSAMVGDSGTAKNGTKHYYYTCKGKRAKTCNKQSEKKDFLEWYIVEQTVNYILTDFRIDFISEKIVDQYKKEFGFNKIQIAEKQLKNIENELDELVNALIKTSSSSAISKINEKLESLEYRKNEIEIEITKLKIANKFQLTVQEVKAWLETFAQGDLMDEKFREKVIDIFINAVYLFDDELVIYYNIKDSKQVSHIEMIDSLEALESSDSFKCGVPTKKSVFKPFVVSLQAFYYFYRIVFSNKFSNILNEKLL